MTKKNLIYAAIILAPYVLCIIGYFILKDLQENNERLSKNQTSLIKGVNNLVMTVGEFKEYVTVNNKDLFEKMSKELKMNIRPGNVTNYNETKVTYGDTTIVEIPVFETDQMFPFEYRDSCWGVKGQFDIFNSKLYITERSADNTVVAVDYVKREKIARWLFGGVRLGKKTAGVFIDTKCGDAKRMEIEVK